MEPERGQHHPEDALESLPIDFVIEILRDHDLPISTLLECRSVCKKWKEIIDGPELRNNIWKKSVLGFNASRENTAYFCCRDRWITRNLTFRPNWSLLMEAYCVSVNYFQQHTSCITQFRTKSCL
ncbi:hypothetical protein MARPO_0240s0001 [Marchantia polymorpha]|uniref:F-box domain-containing protein n=1 Tax=Marchantia polymorpha TaxID=3197 RepID=A0A2R6VZK6_MARPO|nr:hypothetical protein MARPO_0240s0001 [Marchantia polymorpha]|eukprot:PTQ27020.1 hypothetical protein MARPO_0240s0001 [Marchantia polymorpha]